jgi:hypothetical protein
MHSERQNGGESPSNGFTGHMHFSRKLLLVWLLAVLLPVQSIAAILGHCSGGGSRPVSASGVMVERVHEPCPHQMMLHDAAPATHDGHSEHGAGCASCCALACAPAGFEAPAHRALAAFPAVIDQFAQFVPPGLKRPPSSL